MNLVGSMLTGIISGIVAAALLGWWQRRQWKSTYGAILERPATALHADFLEFVEHLGNDDVAADGVPSNDQSRQYLVNLMRQLPRTLEALLAANNQLPPPVRDSKLARLVRDAEQARVKLEAAYDRLSFDSSGDWLRSQIPPRCAAFNGAAGPVLRQVSLIVVGLPPDYRASGFRRFRAWVGI